MPRTRQSRPFCQQVGKQPSYLSKPDINQRSERRSQYLTPEPGRYGREGQFALGGITTGGSRRDGLPSYPGQQFFRQPRFPDPTFTNDKNGAARSFGRLVHRFREEGELGAAPDEWRLTSIAFQHVGQCTNVRLAEPERA